jgi:hypothetical protein
MGNIAIASVSDCSHSAERKRRAAENAFDERIARGLQRGVRSALDQIDQLLVAEPGETADRVALVRRLAQSAQAQTSAGR